MLEEGGAHAAHGASLSRIALSFLTDVVTGVAFAMVLAGCYAVSARPVDGRTGIMWGLAGFAIFVLAPSLGLPPALPGAAEAPLAARQGWWLLSALAAAAGLWCLFLANFRFAGILGVVLIAIPHLIGAPAPETSGTVPATLAARFVAASIVSGAIFWSVLGWASGVLYRRFVTGNGAAPPS